MKKLLLLFLIATLLCGCHQEKSWKKLFQVSELTYKDDYIIGRLKNTSSTAYDLTIRFKLRSGTLEDTGICYETVKPNEIINLECLQYGINESYEISIDSIDYKIIEIPNLTNGNIETETLKYHFETIYSSHISNVLGIATELNATEGYPYFDEIKYYKEKNEIDISYSLQYELTDSVVISETYDTNNQELINISFFFDSNEKTAEIIKNNIIFSEALVNNYYEAESLRRALESEYKEGYCTRSYQWCVFYDNTKEDFHYISIIKK